MGDLAGTARMARRFLAGRGHVELAGSERHDVDDDFGRRLVTFGIIGAISTTVSLVLFLALWPSVGALWANLAALTATFAANSWANARFTARRRQVHWGRALGTFGASLVVSTAALLAAEALGAAPVAEVAVLLASWLAASVARLAVVDGWSRREEQE